MSQGLRAESLPTTCPGREDEVMSEPDAQLKEIVTSFLLSRGLAAVTIPMTERKTPDLLVNSGQTDACLLEIKSKQDDPAELSQLENELATGQVVGRSKSIDYWNRLDAILGEGVEQMTTHDPSRQMHHFIWFHCSGVDAAAAELRLQATLYGTQKLVSTCIKNVITAYYYSNCAFHRYRDALDGVVISRGTKGGLYLNGLSSRISAAQNSAFARAFVNPFLPEMMTIDPDVMICDATAPRGDEQAMLDHLRQKYRVTHLQLMPMGMLSALVKIPGYGH